MKTIQQALKDEVQYPFNIGFIENKLLMRGIDGCARFSPEVARSKEFKGAVADCLVALIEAPNFSEGGISISLSDKELIRKRANSLYRTIGEPDFDASSKPKVSFL